MKNLLFSALCFGFLTSCSTQFYQIYDAESQMVKFTAGSSSMTYDDANCRIDYNLWTEHGNAGFTIFNKTDEVIHLQLDQSFYVLNGMAFDYFQDRIFTNGSNAVVRKSSESVTNLGIFSVYSDVNTGVVSSSSSISINEAKIISIPPKASKQLSEFDINQIVFRDCDLQRFPTTKMNAAKNFSSADSPLRFYNNIVFTKGESTIKTIVRNEFHISQITNIAEKNMYKNGVDEFCNQKGGGIVKIAANKAPNRFYVKYKKDNIDTRKF